MKYSSKQLSTREYRDLPKEDQTIILEEICTNIMYQIENNDKLYEYFTSKKENNIRIYNRLLSHTKKHTDDIFKVIEEYAKSEYKIIPYIENLIKAAAQLGVPIVVVDREYFAEKETDKIDLMKKLITGEHIDEEKYKEYYEQYGNLSKAELIEQLIIKFENNRTGLQFNDKLNRNIFYTRAIGKYYKRNCFINREYAR